jgi:predicted CXXCH cytochrome family protein
MSADDGANCSLPQAQWFMGMLVVGWLVTYSGAALAQAPAAPNGCLTCHSTLADPGLSGPARAFNRNDVHQRSGFTCVNCHGGDSSAVNSLAAKAPATGFVGVPRGARQIQVCARCHSDAAFMRTYAPRQRVDQAVEYATSTHGKRLAAGDARVATCASCHGAHGITSVSDTKSPVHSTNVATTCGACHANPEHMKRSDGSSLPTTQKADYEKSVHFDALMKQHDASAPTCNNCHGNHGATPPGVEAVANVCGTCHGVFAAKFATSPHKAVLDKACVDCHGNHAIAKPSEAMLDSPPAGLCSMCHTDKDDPGRAGADRMRASLEGLKRDIERTANALDGIRRAGMEVGDQELALNSARDQLVLARTELHTFNPAAVAAAVEEGHKTTTDLERPVQEAKGELAFRRRGLVASLSIILIVIAALVAKIRRLDREAP